MSLLQLRRTLTIYYRLPVDNVRSLQRFLSLSLEVKWRNATTSRRNKPGGGRVKSVGGGGTKLEKARAF